jgi:DNA polymerase-3 subunit epsilon
MNAAYDFTILEASNLRHGIDTLVSRLGPGGVQPIIDPFVLDKHADRYRKGGRKLVDLCTTYGVRHTGAHDSAGDALAACRLWPRILNSQPGKFVAQSLPALHQSQIGWRKQQMDSLRNYFDRQGTVHDGCDPSWPLLSGLSAARVAS